MRGFEGFVFSVALPALFVGIFSFAISGEIRRYWRNRGQCIGTSQEPLLVRSLLIWAFVSFWISLMAFVVYRGLRIHYDLWAVQASNVREVIVGERHFTDRSSITQIMDALKSSEWYSVNHGGWGDETAVVVRLASGTEWRMRAGYHFAQHGAVVIRSSQPSGKGWELGEVFSPALPAVLEELGVPLSRCDTVHGHPCTGSQSHLGDQK